MENAKSELMELVPKETGLVLETDAAMITRVQGRVNTIHRLYKDIMVRSGKDKDGNEISGDYGLIPGCGNKPSLLKPGAEKLLMAFRVSPSLSIEMRTFEGGHREYEVRVTLTANDGTVLGEGVGCCSTLESKYRWRTGPKEFTGQAVPKEYWDIRGKDPAKAQELIGGTGHAVGKNPDHGGAWEICIRGEKVENTDPADQYNTVLKMAKKRGLIDAVLTVFGASDIFTQDIEDGTTDARPASKPEAQTKPTATLPPDQPSKDIYRNTVKSWKERAKAQGKAAEKEVNMIIDGFCQVKEKSFDDLTEAECKDVGLAISSHYAAKNDEEKKGGK